jgi:hypothetical protein
MGDTTRRGFCCAQGLAIYRVVQSEVSTPASRDASGGGGQFILRVSVFSTERDQLTELVSFSFVTLSDGFSQVLPTHDGQIVVQTGRKLRLYSSTLKEIKTIDLPSVSWWVISSPFGRKIYAGRTEVYNYGRNGKTTYNILDADSLETLVSSDSQQPQDWPERSDPTIWWRNQIPGTLLAKNEVI